MSAQCVTSLIDLTGKDGTLWQSTPPPRKRTQQHNIVWSRPNQQIYQVYLIDVVQAF